MNLSSAVSKQVGRGEVYRDTELLYEVVVLIEGTLVVILLEEFPFLLFFRL